MRFDPGSRLLGGYAPLDGTIEFYSRIRTIVRPTDVILDLGAGRGAWFRDDSCTPRVACRRMRGTASRVIGADVDPVVLTNPATDVNLLIVDGRIPLEAGSVDIVVADYVLEHVKDPTLFTNEIDRILKTGGFFCARTPHRFNYVSIVARLLASAKHAQWLRRLQPDRREMDVFPTKYRLNTLTELRRYFPELRWTDHSYLYASEPQYFFGSNAWYRSFELLHRVLPRVVTSNIFAFFRKAA